MTPGQYSHKASELNGGTPPNGGSGGGGSDHDRLIRVETKLDERGEQLDHLSVKVGCMSDEQDRMFLAIVDTQKSVKIIADRLTQNVEDTGQFRISIEAQKAADALAREREQSAKLAKKLARREEAITHYTRWALNLILPMLLAGIVALIVMYARAH